MKLIQQAKVNKSDKVDAQWKIVTRLAIVAWRKNNLEDKRDDAELAEQFMDECSQKGWCRKVDGVWQLKELKLNKKKLKKQLEELGG